MRFEEESEVCVRATEVCGRRQAEREVQRTQRTQEESRQSLTLHGR